MYIVEIIPEAENEIEEAYKWYENKQLNLGSRLLDEIEHYIELASENPFQFPVKFSEIYRFITLEVFPYSIVFRVDESTKIIYLISVFHSSRNPSKF